MWEPEQEGENYRRLSTSIMSYRPGGCRTTHRAARKAPPAKVSSATRSMRHFDAFTHPAKENRVVADNVAGTDRLNPDLTLLPFPDKTFSGIDADLIQIAVHSFRQDFRNLERCPARRIFFRR